MLRRRVQLERAKNERGRCHHQADASERKGLRPRAPNGKLRLLFDMTGFHGWDAAAAWEDTKFGIRHFADIERLAMVGEKQWQHGMATFCKPFTKATVRYFDHADAAAARKWLTEP